MRIICFSGSVALLKGILVYLEQKVRASWRLGDFIEHSIFSNTRVRVN